MRHLPGLRPTVLGVVPLLAGLLLPEPLASQATAGPVAADTTIIYLVRHAETDPDGTADPPLATAGMERAVGLRTLLADTRLTGIFSTDLQRTRATAAPIAEASGLSPVYYTPPGMQGLADSLVSTGGRFLIVGHSNTTPYMVQLLGGDPESPMSEDEYDRLYVVTIPPGGAPVTEVRRY